MSRRFRPVLGVAGGVAAAAVLATLAVLPPAASPRPQAPAPEDVAVAFHVHTLRSDGTGTRDQVAAAARAAGVQAVIVTDHGDGTRRTDPPAYVDGVLMIDAVEISTWGGHYVAVGAAPSPFPLAGEPSAVVEDVRRLGGMGIAAHPGSVKDGLRWEDWTAPIDGLEWLNADSEWRDRPGALWRTALAYPWRRAEALAALVDVPVFELAQWDRLAAQRPVVGVAALDAHARLGLRGVGEPYDGWVALEAPSYAASLASFVNRVRLAAPPSGDAAADAAAIVDALRGGRLYSVLTGVAGSGRVVFDAESGGRRASFGGHLPPAGPVRVRVEADVPPAARVQLVCGGAVVVERAGGSLEWQTSNAPGACRVAVQVGRDGRDMPWLLTNPIYVREALTAPPVGEPAIAARGAVAEAATASAWAVERAADATAAVSDVDGGVRFTWQLGSAPATFAAAQLPTPPELGGFDHLIVRASAARPLRVWLQLRIPDGNGVRWGRSVYLDETPREIIVPLASFVPLDRAANAHVPLDAVTALLVVADTVHARPGDGGALTLHALELAR